MIAPPPKLPRADPPPTDPVAPSSTDAIEKLANMMIELAEDVRVLTERIDQIAPLPPPAAEWLPLKQAAHIAGTSIEALRKRAVRGTVLARRHGAAWFVSVESLQAGGATRVVLPTIPPARRSRVV